MPIVIRGETLLLHSERAVVWPARRTVIVADTHFGKSAVLRQHGFAVPAGSDEHDRERLTRLIHGTAALRLIVLGDFVHAPLHADSRDARDLDDWRESLRTEIVVITGNHDRGMTRGGRPAVHWHDGELRESPFLFTHDVDRVPPRGAALDSAPFTLSGHIHPVVRIGGLRKQAPRVPIFWLRRGGLVLPSFGVFTGGHVVTPDEEDSVFAVGSDRVVRFQ